MPKKKPKKAKAYLELNGTINIVHIENGIRTKTPIDGKIILKAILLLLTKGIDKLDSKK